MGCMSPLHTVPQAARKAKRRAEEAALLEGDDGRPASKLQKLFDDTGDEKRARID